MSELAKQIARLADPNAIAREAAASELYWQGRALGEAAIQTWRRNQELADLFVGPAAVGVAVQPETFERIRAATGMPRLAEVPPDQDALEFELHFAHPVNLDILTTNAAGGGGTMAKFLEKSGEGIQQVEFPVTNVDRATELVRARMGAKPIFPRTRPGAGSTRVNFFLVKTPDGRKVLIELVEEPK